MGKGFRMPESSRRQHPQLHAAYVVLHLRAIALHVRRDDGTPKGAVFIPFAYYEAAANLMTNAALDPVGKIPEFKYCAVAVCKGGVLAQSVGYGLAIGSALFAAAKR